MLKSILRLGSPRLYGTVFDSTGARLSFWTLRVLATALAAHADLIVSRDKHLRNLKHFHRIPILNAADALHLIEQQNRGGSGG